MASPSGSLPISVISLATCSSTSTVWLIAVGESFTAVISIVTVDVSLSNSPSLTLKVNESLVAVSELLVYVAVAPSKVTIPSVGWSTIEYVIASPSRSLPVSVISLAVCSTAVTVWASATGIKFWRLNTFT